MEYPECVKMEPGKSISGNVDIKFPIKRTSTFEPGRGEDEVYKMAKNKSGVACTVAFNYMTVNGFYYRFGNGHVEKENIDGYRLIQSQRVILKID